MKLKMQWLWWTLIGQTLFIHRFPEESGRREDARDEKKRTIRENEADN